MLVKDFDYHLPPELIARYPLSGRDASRLLVLDRASGALQESLFKDIVSYFVPGDLLVLNNTRVIPARLLGCRESGGKTEIFLVRRVSGEAERWVCLLKASKKFREGQTVILAAGMIATIVQRNTADSWLVSFSGAEPFQNWLEREGHIPLPPYLQRSDDQHDRERYQTVFAQVPGAVAAPTAGLHFTQELLENLTARGVLTASLTLHTGLGTFLPVRVDQVEDHRIHVEQYEISSSTAAMVQAAKARGSRIIAVGTTAARALEYASDEQGSVIAGSGEADIFIYPGYSFKTVDALITNFHLPESTLLMLVSAFAGRANVFAAYQEAIERGYRFYSYGDAMLIV